MKKYIYKGSGILAFTHEGTDYVLNEEGPHALPLGSEHVKSLVAQGILVEETKVSLKNN